MLISTWYEDFVTQSGRKHIFSISWQRLSSLHLHPLHPAWRQIYPYFVSSYFLPWNWLLSKKASPVLFTSHLKSDWGIKIKLNSLLPLHLGMTKLRYANDFLPTSKSRSWPLAPDGLTVFTLAGIFAFQTAFLLKIFLSHGPSTLSLIIFALNFI